MDEDDQAKKIKDCLLSRNGEMHATPRFSSAATCRSEPFVTLPKFRSRLIQLSLPGAAASSWAE
jgi:hypothetical protein